MIRVQAIRAFTTAAVLAFAACGGAPDAGDDEPVPTAGTLTVEPAQSEHLILNGVQPKQDYTATLTHDDGTTEDVTGQATFLVAGGVGGFDHSELTMAAPGKGAISATVTTAEGEVTGSAAVIVRLQDVRIADGIDAGIPGLFGTATDDATRAPNVLYPPLDAAMPRNIGDFEVHWNDASTNDVYELSLKTELTDVRVYVRGGNGAGNGPNPTWSAFKATEWADAVGPNNSILYQVRGLETAHPETVGASAPRTVTLTHDALEGGIYYWAAAGTAASPEGIWRHDMGKPGEPAEAFYTVEQTGRCVACHVLSRDGTRMALTWDGGNRNSTVIDVASRTPMADLPNWNFGTFNPDASRFLGVSNGVLTVYNAADMSPMGTMPVDVAGTKVSHPDLSPDGTLLVYTHDTPDADWSFRAGTIWTRAYDATTNAWGAETPLVSDGINNYYPSWSPDGQWILFNRSIDASTSYNNQTASLWAVKSDGSKPPVQLAAANATGNLTNSWGRWAPFEQTIGAASESIFWVTVSSQRDFGVRLVGSNRPQIWMTPFYPDRAAAGQDPSAPAFRLPFQNIETNNHIAQWTERVVVLSREAAK